MNSPVTSELRTKLVNAFADAIAHEEGFYLTPAECKDRKIPFPSIAQGHNNPGNMRAWGSYPVVEGYAKFDTVNNGWRAIRKQCDRNIFDRELTFIEFFAGQRNASGELIHPSQSYPGFAPATDDDIKHGINRPDTYAQDVLNRLHASDQFNWANITVKSKIKSLVA